MSNWPTFWFGVSVGVSACLLSLFVVAIAYARKKVKP